MEKTTGTRTGRKPKNDPADRKYSFRLNAEENTRFERLLADSGARDRTLFIKKSIFSGQIKVVRIDKATIDYYIKLTEFHKQFQAIGNNYNQVVRALKNNFGEKRAMSLLYRLEKLSVELCFSARKSRHSPRNTSGNGCKDKSWRQRTGHWPTTITRWRPGRRGFFRGTA